MRLRTISRDRAGEADSQPRKISCSLTPGDPGSKAHRWSEARPYFRELNRQIPELESPVTLRKQTTANCSNGPKIQFCKNEIPTQKLRHSARTGSLTEESRPHISNRELLGLEILQLTENKHQRPVLIANFEPNHQAGFRAFVAAAFSRAWSPLSPSSLERADQPGKSSQRNGCSK